MNMNDTGVNVGQTVLDRIGTPDKPWVVQAEPGKPIRVARSRWVLIRGLTVEMALSDKVDVQDSENIWIDGCTVAGAGTGVSVQRSKNVEISGLKVPGLVPLAGVNCEGIYVGETTGLAIRGCELLDVGMPGPTMFNHGIYVNGACDQVSITDNVVDNAASTGIQARAGGHVAQNWVRGCPVGITYAHVNGGGPQHKGGCSGIMERNVVSGNRALTAADPLGYGVVVGANCLDVTVQNNLVTGDVVGKMNPWQIQNGRGEFEKDQIGIKSLRLIGNVTAGYKKPGLYIDGSLKAGKAGTPGQVESLILDGNQGLDIVFGGAGARVTGAKPQYVGGIADDLAAMLRSFWPTSVGQPQSNPPSTGPVVVPGTPPKSAPKAAFKAYLWEGTRQLGELLTGMSIKWTEKTWLQIVTTVSVQVILDGAKVSGDGTWKPGRMIGKGTRSIQVVIGEDWYRYNVKVV